jgi:hypothetical protein
VATAACAAGLEHTAPVAELDASEDVVEADDEVDVVETETEEDEAGTIKLAEDTELDVVVVLLTTELLTTELLETMTGLRLLYIDSLFAPPQIWFVLAIQVSTHPDAAGTLPALRLLPQ